MLKFSIFEEGVNMWRLIGIILNILIILSGLYLIIDTMEHGLQGIVPFFLFAVLIITTLMSGILAYEAIIKKTIDSPITRFGSVVHLLGVSFFASTIIERIYEVENFLVKVIMFFVTLSALVSINNKVTESID